MAETEKRLKRRFEYYNREFLNRPAFEGGGHILAQVPTRQENYRSGATVTIADCSDSITLDFYIGTEGSVENTLHKLDTLIGTLQDFREAVKKTIDDDRRGKHIRPSKDEDY